MANHSHHHSHYDLGKRFQIGIILNFIFIITEVFFGIKANSLALIADAVHNAGDVLGLFVAWFGYWLAQKQAPSKFTFGFKSATIIAAFINALLLFVATGGIIWESIERFGVYEVIASKTVMLVAFIGVVINGITAAFFFTDRNSDINIKGAFLHMLLDALVSLGVIIAAFFIFLNSWYWIDPIISLCIALVILISSWGLFKESLHLMLLATPSSIDLKKLNTLLNNQIGVTEIHDLHIWPLGTTENALSVHVIVTKTYFKEDFVINIENLIKHEFPTISHITIQLESEDFLTKCATIC